MAILIFILCLSALIFIHEFGHFLAAKKAGIKVEEFGFGYPPRIWGFKKRGTFYSINALPFGGFVKIFGEDGKERHNRRSFASRKPGTRMGILAAGIALNLAVGMALLGFGYFIGLPAAVTEENIGQLQDINLSILNVSAKTPAAAAGLKAGDIILAVKADGEQTSQSISEDFQKFVKKHQGETIVLVIQRQNSVVEKSLTSRLNPPSGEGPLGIVIGEVGILRYSWWQSFINGIRDGLRLFLNIFLALFYFIKGLFVGTQSVNDVVGVVGITALGSQTVKLGIRYVLQFLAALSVNLAALNLVPFPALDGSRILFVLIEKIKGKPVSVRVENFIHSFGFAFLILLTIIITTKDVLRLF